MRHLGKVSHILWFNTAVSTIYCVTHEVTLARLKREPGVNPGLSRSGKWERTRHICTGSNAGKQSLVGKLQRAHKSEDLPDE